MLIFGVCDGNVMHLVALRLEVPGKGSHSRKYAQDLLRMVKHIIRLLPHLHQRVNHIRLRLLKPGMKGIELVTQNEPQNRPLRKAECAHELFKRFWL
jgi:hypothetical protein